MKNLENIFLFTLIAVVIVLLPNLCHASTEVSRGFAITVPDQGGEEENMELYHGSYALLIGVSKYSAGWPVLDSIPAEIDHVERLLLERGFHVTKVIDPDGTKLSSSFENFINSYGLEKNNRLLFFFSGHGFTRNDGRRGYLIPVDAPDPEKDLAGFLKKSLGMNQVLSWARDIESKHALFLFDSCFSGTIFKQKSRVTPPRHITRLTIEPVRQFITAGSAGEEVPANSTFTPAFIDGLRFGLADLNNDGYISATELGLYLQTVVPEHTNQNPQYGKIRDYDLSRGDFIFMTDSTIGTHTEKNTEKKPYSVSGKLGIFRVQSDPVQASVYMDNIFQGSSPLTLNNVPPGNHSIRVEKQGYITTTKEIRLSPGKSISIDFTLVSGNTDGTLTVTTTPRGAIVNIVNSTRKYFDGIKIPTGDVDLEISKYGFQTTKLHAQVGENENLHLKVTLQTLSEVITPDNRENEQHGIADKNADVDTSKPVVIPAVKQKVVHSSQPDLPPEIIAQIKKLQSPISKIRRDTAKRTYRKAKIHPAILVVVEKQLLRGYLQYQDDSQHLDALAWFCNILGKTKEKKYLRTLQTVADSNSHRKVKKYALKNIRIIQGSR